MTKEQQKTQAKTKSRPKKDLFKTQLDHIVKESEDKEAFVSCWCCSGVLLKEIAVPIIYESWKNGVSKKYKGHACPDCHRKIRAGEVVKED